MEQYQIFLLWGFHKDKALKFGTGAEKTHNDLNFKVAGFFVTPRRVIDD